MLMPWLLRCTIREEYAKRLVHQAPRYTITAQRRYPKS
jgi:hypothetical protein